MPRRARVVVSTYERLPLLRRALRGWLHQTTNDFALTVADDGSGPETAEFVAAFARVAPFPVEHVRLEHEGFRKARITNEAVRRADGEPLIVMTDGDCIPPPRFLERHVAAHGPRTFAVGGAYRLDRETTERLTEADVDDPTRLEALVTPAGRRDLWRRRWKSRAGVWLRLPRRPKTLGLNIGIDRALYEEVNGFDEEFVGYGLEDSDLRDRLMRLAPRPVVRVLYGENDVFHQWHPMAPSRIEFPNRGYYETARPIRCSKGLLP